MKSLEQKNKNSKCKLYGKSFILISSFFAFSFYGVLSNATLQDSVIIESEEALAQTYEAELDHDEAARRFNDVKQETDKLVSEAKTNISNSITHQKKLKRDQMLVENEIARLKANLKKTKAEELKVQKSKVKYESKLSLLEKEKSILAQNVETQKVRNETLVSRVKNLKEQKKLVLQQIYKSKIQLAQLKKRIEKRKSNVKELDHEVKKLIARRNQIKKSANTNASLQ